VNVMFINNFVYFALLIFSGANVAIERFPVGMQSISWAMPLTRGIAAARLLIAGSTLSDISPLLWGVLGIGLLYGFIGYLLFAWFEIVAKRRGTLEVF